MTFASELAAELAAIREAGLLRELRRVDSPQGATILHDGRSLLNFSSNDYLGLANHPAVREAAIAALGRFGAGSGASRLICGSLAPHHELEEALCAFKRTEAALSFTSGYATALGVIGALVGKEDVIVLDKLVHASIVDAARLSGAKMRVFKHNDLNDLEEILSWAGTRRTEASAASRRSRTLVVTESVFSMDGDVAPLREIVALKEKHGAWLMVDEAHGTGLFGPNRRGVAEEQGIAGAIEVQMGTLGKAIGSAGGYVCGRRELVDLLVNRARSFIFSTAPPPSQAAGARAGIEIIAGPEGEQRRNAVWKLVDQFKADFRSRIPDECRSAILPLIIGGETEALSLAQRLREAGIFVPAIRYPTVARGAARLRVTVTASHSPEQVQMLVENLRRLAEEP